MALDALIVNNAGPGQPGWGGFGRFTYGGMTVGPSTTLGRYGAFTVSEPGASGSGVGINFALGSPAIDSPRDLFAGAISPVTANMFPLLDRATFGINFDPTQYAAELVYKPLPGNTATQLNMTLDTTDGFIGGQRAGEQWQWGFTDLVNRYNTLSKDADGFVTVRNNDAVNGNGISELSQADSFFNGQSFVFQTSPVTNRDMSPDFNDFEGDPLAVPNGVVQIHLQTVYGGDAALIDNWEVKALRIVKLAPDAREVARLDGRSGFSLRFGSAFERNNDTPININGTDYLPPATDQVSRFNQSGFTNIVLNTDDDDSFGGLALWQSAATTVFDATSATVEFRARLTQPLVEGQADHLVLIVKDKDGNDTGEAGDFGADEYRFNLQLNQLNTTSMTTVSIPISSFTRQIAQEFVNPGDEALTNFNLYYLGLQSDMDAGLLDLEIESMRVLLPGLSGDLDGDNDVDGNDFLVWQRGEADPNVLAAIKANFGMTGGAGAASAVPEPSAMVLAGALAVAGLGVLRRRNA
jgi:hypothetical protein